MLNLTLPKLSTLLTVAAMACVMQSAAAVQVRVTVRNTGVSDSVALSPIIMAAHDGSVDLFSSGSLASAGIEDVAEMGGPGATLIGEVTTAQATAVTEVGVATSGGFGPGILIPGAEASYVLSLDPTMNRYFSYAAMVVPSNDSFIGNDDPMGVELFDGGGNFVGAGFELTGSQIWDAGSEVNDLAGAAYIDGGDAALGTEDSSPVSLVSDLNDQFGTYLGLTTPTGTTFNSLPPANEGFVTFSFQVVPEPASYMIAGMGALGLLLLRRRVA
ncbi:spondin domain-containing protein [Aeoliella sp. ICT_H6.2]|uniref:Spondin domain-containing protein n=1 Tax=Aeoliella straminimaris TaxID=2954799 RepID=A0A9X2F5H3_9BACT|nr:spondin domain-containing protein [Aeoliella straminimaris]MCO6042617.1 spondin domain-containing protein [Aeoliella straminimaris]